MIIMYEIEFTHVEQIAVWNGWKGGNTNKLMIIMYEIEFTHVEQIAGWNGWMGGNTKKFPTVYLQPVRIQNC